MKSFLTPEARQALIQEHRTEKCKKRADRMKVVLWSDEGVSQEEIAKRLFLHVSTVQEHLQIYKEEERIDIKNKGSQPILTTDESQKLAEHLSATIYTKAKYIQSYIFETFSKKTSLSCVTQWLKSHNFVYKKPKLVPKGADAEKQKEFIEHYHQTMTEAALNGEPVLFGDAVHPTQQTQAFYGWMRRGHEKKIETTAGRKRVNLDGVLNLENMSIIRGEFVTINGAASIKMLEKIETEYPDAERIHLIWDQAGYHTCREVKEYLATSRIRVHFLPPRSPNLNPIERLWKIMHEHVSHNKVYKNFQEFKKALDEFFDTTVLNIKEDLISRITDNFQIIAP